jgi:hypothetical protein
MGRTAHPIRHRVPAVVFLDEVVPANVLCRLRGTVEGLTVYLRYQPAE